MGRRLILDTNILILRRRIDPALVPRVDENDIIQEAFICARNMP